MSTVAFIHVGDELLTGKLDPYPAKMIERTRERGAEVVLVAAVRDDVDEIAASLRFAMATADIAVVTGGLGPTLDDVTREALAGILGTELVVDEEAAQWMDEAMERMHGAAKRSEIRLRMARVPRGCTALRNITGMACGVEAIMDGTTFLLLPGFPDEMGPMFEKHVLPRIAAEGCIELETSVWKGESTLDPLFRETASRFGVRVASLPSADWRDRGNRVVIKGRPDAAKQAMAYFLEEEKKLGPELSCL